MIRKLTCLGLSPVRYAKRAWEISFLSRVSWSSCPTVCTKSVYRKLAGGLAWGVETPCRCGYHKHMSEPLSLWTIYDHPTDVPEPFGFVVRRWLVATDVETAPDSEVKFAMTLEEARALVPPGLYRLDRDPNDDPKIVETWI